MDNLIWYTNWDGYTLLCFPLGFLEGGIVTLVAKKMIKPIEYSTYEKMLILIHILFIFYIYIFSVIAHHFFINANRYFPNLFASIYVTIPCVFHLIFMHLKRKRVS